MFRKTSRTLTRFGLVLLAASVVVAAELDLSWYTVDGGGETFSSGGDFELSGTIGQPDAGTITGGEFELTGGFWFPIPLGDCEDDGDVDLFDHSLFESCLGGPDVGVATGCRCLDMNHTGTVDLLDFAIAQTNFTGL